MRATLLLARRELGRHPLRTALTAAGVGCGVARAAKTVRNITGLEVTGKRVKVERGQISEYRVEMKLIFLLED